jgi:hypothetical protein
VVAISWRRISARSGSRRARDRAPRLAHEQGEQVELLGGEVQLALAAPRPPRGLVDPHPGRAQLAVARGQHQDRHLRLHLAHVPADVEPAHPRQADVEDDQVRRLVEHRAQRVLPVARRLHVVARPRERPRERLGDVPVVLDEQHAGHRSDARRAG